jgi:RNA polymerase sigma factor (sigma-70 family)
MSEASIEDLLGRLSTGRIDSAWREFLERYSPLIMHIVRRYESDHGQVTDCYLHACSELSNDGFRRLLRYRPGGAAKFQTWLSAVVANLCIDWRRKQRGRFRPVEAIASLPELDRLVYRQIYVRGFSREECLHSLQARYPALTGPQLADINSRIFSLLTPQQRWQLSVRSADMMSLDQSSWFDPDEATWQVEDPGLGPAEHSEREQQFRQLEAAMAKLPAQQRLMLRLRYQQNLTLEEVARLMRLPDPFRANRQIQAALAALADLMTPERRCEKRPPLSV